MDDSFVYRKSGLGAAQLVQGHELSLRERQVLILIDGHRTVAELSEVFGADTVRRVVRDLLARGFAKQVDTSRLDAWNEITQIRVDGVVRQRRAAIPAADGFPFGWIAFLTLLALVAGHWQVDRYGRRLDASWAGGQTWAQARSIDEHGVPTLSDAIDARAPIRRAPIIVPAITDFPEATEKKALTGTSPQRATSPAVVPRRLAVARGAPRGVAPVHATGSAAAHSTVPDAAPALMAKADVPAVQPSAASVATVAELSAAAVALPSAVSSAAPDPAALAPSTMPSPAPVLAAVAPPPASAPAAEAAVQPAVAPPASDPGSLRPLLHDPPRFPEQARRDGIAEGQVRAHIRITSEGKVDQVDVVQATPPGVFDEEVRRALSLWTFEPLSHATEQIVDVTLKP